MRRASDFSRSAGQRGVTLIEMIVVIVVSGILLSVVGMFTRNQITSYIDVANRTELADAADSALRRMAREIQGALPNSVRAAGDALEFVPIKDAGRYRALKDGAADDPLDFDSATDNAFDVFGPAPNWAAGDSLVIYNLGIPGADVYTGTNRRALIAPSPANPNKLAYAVGAAQFPLASPQNRFQIVGGPVSYVCDRARQTLWRYSGYAFQASQPDSLAKLDALPGVTRARLALDINADPAVAAGSACSLSYVAGALQRNGLVSMRLTLTRNGESVELLHQVDVMNSP